jgi:hypothetical protein
LSGVRVGNVWPGKIWGEALNVRVSVLAASALCVALLTGSGQAQVPTSAVTSTSAAPLHSFGFMPPYEIARKVRRAGFEPLSPPLREGSIYVVRATDFRGILMRVVVDARSGVIRDASRIVPGPGSYGQQAAMLPYEPLPNEIPGPPYSRPADYEAPPVPLEDGEMAPHAPVLHPVTRASVTVLPPLPRPRPPELAARQPDDAKPDAKPAAAANPQAKSESKAEVTGSAAAPPAASSSPPAPATAAVKPRKSPEPPPIND